MMRKFEMTDLGMMEYFLGIQVMQENGNIFISQEKKIRPKHLSEPCRIFIYLTHTRPDILHVVSLISRFMSNPSKSQFAAAKRILHYIQGTKHLGIKYSMDENNELLGFRDSDWLEAKMTGRGHWDTFFAWDQKQFRGVRRSKIQLICHPQRRSTLLRMKRFEKQFGSEEF
ncbi:uncharacterized mitochondrial protein AtMg00810-like [Andrographis paniculata]|uniref:uncharacterized mitochondrial protein AtMg00810-like n=1 Tax=Andrographis paniculata TaxID=175694 RepID=UPI0021E935CE|nr:uncharacterized mitochondrial protein AtMg00810-like [Andrographis paniculata]